MLDWKDVTGSNEKFTEAEVESYLQRVRDECVHSNVAHLVRYVVRGCRQLGFDLEADLGTTEGNLRDMEREGWKAHARFFLEYLRKWPMTPGVKAEDIVRHICDAAEQAECLLEVVDTNDAELRMFEERGKALTEASKRIIDVRMKPSPDAVQRIRELLQAAQCPFSHIDTTEEELAQLSVPATSRQLRAY